MSFLKVSPLQKFYGDSVLLNTTPFSINKLQKVAIAGETGSGKSTLLKIIAGLIQPTSGEVWLEGEKVLGPEEKLMAGHPSIAYLSQHFELRNNYRVEEILEMSNKMADNEANLIFEVCRITHLLKRGTNQLSGGEKQRIATAKLLITSPKLLLLDEPFSNLDFVHKTVLKSVIGDISEQLNITCILISHDPLDILSWADDIIVMKEGAIVQQGTPESIYRAPNSEYVAALFGNYKLLTAATANVLQRGYTPEDGLLLARPEDIAISAEGEGAMGKLQGLKFFGSYYELEVLINEQLITVKCNNANLKQGDNIYLQLLRTHFLKG